MCEAPQVATDPTLAWLAVATSLHAGFQLTVTVVVYPALADVADDDWTARHASHSRRITWVVGPVYVGLAAACLAILVAGPRSPLALVAVAASAAAAGLTAFVAAPAHARLGGGRRPEVLTRLLRADRLRLAAALVGAGTAVAALLLD